MPAVDPSTNLQMLPLLFFASTSGLPIVAAILCGLDVMLSDAVYLESLLDYSDRSLIREALNEKTFTGYLASVIFSCLDCTQIPTPSNIRQLLIDTAKHQFKIKPLEALYSMYSGVPMQYQPFWKQC